MKAIRINNLNNQAKLEFTNIEEPNVINKNDIKVRVYATSLNYHDLGVVSGHMPTQNGRIPMADCSGIVEELGSDVTEFNVGDHVISTFFPTWLNGSPEVGDFSTVPGDGIDGFAQEVVVKPASSFTLAPKNYSHIQAATLTTAGLTAWRALVINGQIKKGETVLVLGTGGVSLFALQIAKELGANVIATSSSEAKIARLKELGADHVINYRETPLWGNKVLELTNGKGVDHVVEVGGANTFEQSTVACKVGGHIALIGVLSGVQAPINIANIVIKQQHIQGLVVGNREQQNQFVNALENYSFYPIISNIFKFKDLERAFEFQKNGEHFGKICVEY